MSNEFYDIPNFYTPLELRVRPEAGIRDLAFQISKEVYVGQLGTYSYSTIIQSSKPQLIEILEHVGQDDHVIIRLNEDGTDTLMYRWQSTSMRWVLVI